MIGGIGAAAAQTVSGPIRTAQNSQAAPEGPVAPATKPTSPQAGKSPVSRVSPASMNVMLQAQGEGKSSAFELSEEEQKVVRELKETDRKVRAHEQAHLSAGGAYAGPVSYETVTGPDNREYAVAGEVAIDASPVPNNPKATIRKMDIVIRAALAPAQPSPQDFAVARAAQQARIQAQNELAKQQLAELRGDGENDNAALEPPAPSAEKDNGGNGSANDSAAEVVTILFGS